MPSQSKYLPNPPALKTLGDTLDLNHHIICKAFEYDDICKTVKFGFPLKNASSDCMTIDSKRMKKFKIKLNSNFFRQL